jgi:hypothetical protein
MTQRKKFLSPVLTEEEGLATLTLQAQASGSTPPPQTFDD